MDFSAGSQTLLTGTLNAKNKEAEKQTAANVLVEKAICKAPLFLLDIILHYALNVSIPHNPREEVCFVYIFPHDSTLTDKRICVFRCSCCRGSPLPSSAHL